MWVFPLGAAAVSGYFGAILALQWSKRHRPHLLAWSIALGMFGIASAATAIGLLAGWTPVVYRIYYLFGAIANVPVLALGTVYLLARRPLAHLCAVVVVIATVGAAVIVATADISSSGLDVEGIPRGSDVVPPGIRLLSRSYSIVGFVIVVGGAVWSALRLLRQREVRLRRLAGANLLIAAGVTVVAVASEVARLGTGSAQGFIFAVGLFVGVSVMFLGFTRTRPPRASRAVPPG